MRRLLLVFAALFFVSAPVTAQDAAPAGKLPDTVKPIAYRVDMTIVPKEARFSGHTEIDIELKKAASSIYMHGRDLKVSKAVARVGTTETPVTFTQESPLGLAKLDFGKTMQPGKMTLIFDHDAEFGTGPSGVYHVKAGDDWYSWSQFESIDARAAFPSFDEPGYKTPFTVSLTTTPGFVAASNAPEIGTEKVGEMEKHRFAPTLPMPTYLIAFVVGPFETVETLVPPSPQREKPLPVRIIATKPNKDKMAYALEHTGKIVTLLESYFNQPFPYPKLDQIGSPIMPGAMENAGADIYGDGILLLGADAGPRDEETFGMVVAHELSHQWFGDLVTPAWWDDIWLNESFANWMGYRIGNEWRPDLHMGASAIEEAFDAMQLDGLTVGRPIHEKIETDGAINAAFDQITYGKGGQVVAMIAAYMGDEKFREGVRLHMSRHPYGNATTDDFFSALADAAKDERVLDALRSFVNQPGVPVVTLTRKGNGYTATQAPYAYFGANAPARQWVIPFCIRREAVRSCTLIDRGNEPVKTAGTGAIVPNAGGQAYYRFDMDRADWDALLASSPKLTEGEALAVIDSLWSGFYAGKERVPLLVSAAKKMLSHPNPDVAVENGQRLAELEAHGMITPEALPAFRQLFREIYSPMLADLGFDPAEGVYAKEDIERQQLRGAVVSLLGRAGHDPAVRAKLIAAADAYLAGDTKALDSRFLVPALTAAVQDRGVEFAKTLADKALAGDNQTLQRSAIRAVTGSGDPAVAKWFATFQDPRIPMMARIGSMSSMLDTVATSDTGLTYMLGMFDMMSGGGNGGIFAARAAGMFGVLCTSEQADKVDAKLRPALKEVSSLALDRAVEQIRNCARFRDAKSAEVSAGVMAAAAH